MTKRKLQKKSIRKDRKLEEGVIGVILSVIGLLFSFNIGIDNFLLFVLFLLMIIVGIILVAHAVSD